MQKQNNKIEYITIQELKEKWGVCPNCGKPFIKELEIAKDELGKYTNCLECNGSFDI